MGDGAAVWLEAWSSTGDADRHLVTGKGASHIKKVGEKRVTS